MKTKPPFLLHLLAIFFLLASLACLFGVIQTITSWNWLLAVDYYPHPAYNIFENAFLFLAFLVSAVILWARLPWAPVFCQAVTLLAGAWYWFDRIVITAIRMPFREQIFPILVTLLVLFLLLFSLYLIQPYMKALPSIRPVGDEDENPSS
jgi:hypothetical protein